MKITEQSELINAFKTTAKMNNLNAHAGSDRCKIASSAEKPSRNDDSSQPKTAKKNSSVIFEFYTIN
jgi:hypothetical protein